MEKIFRYSIEKHGKYGKDPNVSVDSTVQEKNITYPTDAKLHKKIIDKCVAKVKKDGVVLRRSYKRTSKQLLRDSYNGSHPRRRKKAKASRGKLKTIAGRLVRELERKLAFSVPSEFITVRPLCYLNILNNPCYPKILRLNVGQTH